MQNIDLICVGKLNAKYFAEGVASTEAPCRLRVLHIIELPGGRRKRSRRRTPRMPW